MDGVARLRGAGGLPLPHTPSKAKQRERERESEREGTTLGHPMLYSRAHPLRIRDGVALTSGPQGLPVAATPEQKQAKREHCGILLGLS